jgi:hypothetical protein
MKSALRVSTPANFSSNFLGIAKKTPTDKHELHKTIPFIMKDGKVYKNTLK